MRIDTVFQRSASSVLRDINLTCLAQPCEDDSRNLVGYRESVLAGLRAIASCSQRSEFAHDAELHTIATAALSQLPSKGDCYFPYEALEAIRTQLEVWGACSYMNSETEV